MTARYWAIVVSGLLVLGGAVPAPGGGGPVAVVNCDLSCPDDSGHLYVDCGNGTVTDNRTGLVWLANAGCFGQLSWREAMAVVSGLGDLPGHACLGMGADACDCGLDDGSAPGEWRLPTMAELEAVISPGGDTDACLPRFPNDSGNSCWEEGCYQQGTCSFYDVQAAVYWTASTYPGQPGDAWVGDLVLGLSYPLASETVAHVWPVRGGQ